MSGFSLVSACRFSLKISVSVWQALLIMLSASFFCFGVANDFIVNVNHGSAINIKICSHNVFSFLAIDNFFDDGDIRCKNTHKD